MTPAEKALNLQDARPDAWKGERQRDMDPDLLRLCMAYDRLKAAQRACDTHEPPYAGAEWAEKTRAYAEAKADLEAEFARIRVEGP